jgi:uncharacterized membrane protein YebE (DUF533 family)
MSKKIITAALLGILVVIGYLAYRHYANIKDTAELTPEQNQEKHAK